MIELLLLLAALVVGAVVLGIGAIALPVGFGLGLAAFVVVASLWCVGFILRVIGWIIGALFALILSIVTVPLVLVLGLALSIGTLLALVPVVLPLAAIGAVIWLCVRRRPTPPLVLPAA